MEQNTKIDPSTIHTLSYEVMAKQFCISETVATFSTYIEAIPTFDKTFDHHIDACVISSSGNTFNVKSDLLLKRDIPEGDKQQTKGIRGEQRLNTYKIQGFRKFDRVRYFGKEYFIKGRMSSGYAVLMDIEGNKVDFSNLPKGYKTPKLSLCKRISARRSQLLCVTKN